MKDAKCALVFQLIMSLVILIPGRLMNEGHDRVLLNLLSTGGNFRVRVNNVNISEISCPKDIHNFDGLLLTF